MVWVYTCLFGAEARFGSSQIKLPLDSWEGRIATGGRAMGELLPRTAVPAKAPAAAGGAEVVGSQQVRREIQAERFCFIHVTLHC